ncbi:MAG: LPS export ABC transporter permease LptG [Nevskia sp.]
MGGPLARYLRGLLAMRTVAVLMALGGLLQVLDLLDTSTDILSRGQGLGGIVHYTLLRSPTVILSALPLSALLGAVFAFSALARQNEVVAMRAAGVPFRRVVLILLPTVIAIALFHLALAEVIVPRTQKALTAWWASLPPSPEADEADADLLWFRTEGAVVGVVHVLPDGSRLDGVRIYRRDAAGHLTTRLVATTARYENRRWTLDNVVETDFAAGRTSAAQPGMDWDTPLKPADLARLSASEPYVSAGLAAAVLSGAQSGIKTPAFYRTRIQRSFADPFSAMIMLLLATPVAVALTRGAQRGSPLLVTLVSGLLFLLLNGLMSALGEASLLAPEVAAWTTPAAFALIGAAFLFRLDRH